MDAIDPEVGFRQRIGYAKHLKGNLELLKLQTDLLYNRREVIKEEINRELIMGKMTTIESRAWLGEVEEILSKVDAIVNAVEKFEQNKRGAWCWCLGISLRMKLGEDVVNVIDEISGQLEKYIFEQGPSETLKKEQMRDTQRKENEKKDELSIESKMPEQGNKAARKKVASSRKKRVKRSNYGSYMEDKLMPKRKPAILGKKYEAGLKDTLTKKDASRREKEKMREDEISSLSDPEGISVIEVKEMYTPSVSDTEDTTEKIEFTPEIDVNKISTPVTEGKMMPVRRGETGRAPVGLEGVRAGVTLEEEEEEEEGVQLIGRQIYRKETEFRHGTQPFTGEEKRSHMPETKIELTSLDVMAPTPRITAKTSIQHTLKEVLEGIKDVKARKIGIYGTSGIGKTTLLKALNDLPEIKIMFDVVIWVSVSKDWSLQKMQNEVARQLSLDLAIFKPAYENAEKIFHLLKDMKFLLLLDDVSGQINLIEIGIPDPNLHSGCRIVLTSQSVHVCRSMGTHKTIKVDAVSREEAWELFHENVGEIIDSPVIEPFARAIVEECGGLPLVIIVIGRALKKEQDVQVWRHALRELLSLNTSGDKAVKFNLQQLKFSYDRLKGDSIKSCFLSCASYPEKHEIEIPELIELWIAKGLITENSTDAHKKGYDILKVLIDASLLESMNGGRSVKMHNVIRDLALEIMSKKEEDCQVVLRPDVKAIEPPKEQQEEQDSIFPKYYSLSRLLDSSERTVPLSEGHRSLSRSGERLTQPPEEEEWVQAESIFLMDNELSSLPESPKCHKLLRLFLQRNFRLRNIPASFFEYMPFLEVLDLSNTRVKSLPSSVSKLASLRGLILRDCERLAVLPSEVGSLKNLEMLDLRGTKINYLPNEIGKLTCLWHLEVSFYWYDHRDKTIPPKLLSQGIISSLFQLKILSIVVDPEDRRWNEILQAVTEEVGSLVELTTLHFYFPQIELLERFIQMSSSWKDGYLRRFRFIVGYDIKRLISRVPNETHLEYEQQDRCLRFVNGVDIPVTVLEVLTHATAFYLDCHHKVHSLSDFGIKNLNGLEFGIVRECREIETIVEGVKMAEGAAFPLLEYLSIYYLWNLRSIWEGSVPPGSLARLKSLTLHTCPKLRYVFEQSMLQHLPNLEELEVKDCPIMKVMILGHEILDSEILLPRLKRLLLHYLPELGGIWKDVWKSLEHVSFYNCPNLKNLGIDIQFTKSILEIKGEKDWWDALEWKETSLLSQLQPLFVQICDDDL